jgi:hypothetical protein
VVFKEKKPFKKKNLTNWQEEEKLLFEEIIKDIKQKESLEANIQTPVKANLTKNFSLNTKIKFLDLTNLPIL